MKTVSQAKEERPLQRLGRDHMGGYLDSSLRTGQRTIAVSSSPALTLSGNKKRNPAAVGDEILRVHRWTSKLGVTKTPQDIWR